MRRRSLAELLAARAASPRPAFTFDDGYRTWTHTHAQIARRAAEAARELRARGVAPGDKVILWAENRPGWIIALWACLREGLVAVPIDFRSSPAFVEKVEGIVGAKARLVAADLERFERLAGIDPATDTRPEGLAEILFTSGATAEPKGVLISHRNLLANLEPVENEILKYRGHPAVRWLAEPLLFPIRFLNLLPLSHLFGQTMAAFIPPMVDGHVWFARSQNPAELERLIQQRRISVVVCVPKMMELLRDHIVRVCPEAATPMPPGGRPGFLGNWWRYRRVHRRLGWKFWAFVVGAAPLDPELEAFWRKLGYVVIQGYGLTETAPIVSLNHPFHPSPGSVGKPIAGVELRLAPDGEILVKGENVTAGYYGGAPVIAADGWFHTGDVGEMGPDGAIRIRGRKKEMIVTPDGLNVFPDDVERALLAQPGVRDAAVVEKEQRVHAVLVLEDPAAAEAVIAAANAELEAHQRVRTHSAWPAGEELPRTEGTRKLKRAAIRDRVLGLTPAASPAAAGEGTLASVVARYAGGRPVGAETTLDQLGLSSLERVQLLLELEEKLGRPLDEGVFTGARTVADLGRAPAPDASATEPLPFPAWARRRWARLVRDVSLPGWILPLARIFLWVRARGLERLEGVEGPVIFAANHQSYLDTAALLAALPARWRRRVCPAMRAEFFDAHFHPERHGAVKRMRNSLAYHLAALMFHAFPLPQREAGTKQALRYAGELASEGWSILLFPEGRHAEDGEAVGEFQPGIGMMAARLGVPVVPVRLRGVSRVLHPAWRMARPGRVEVAFGRPMTFAGGLSYAQIAREVEEAVKSL